jgi:hypothetical protein
VGSFGSDLNKGKSFIEHKCRVCGSESAVPFADLGVSPIANEMLSREDAIRVSENFYPLNAVVCKRCWLVQLTYSHPAKSLFTDSYPYYSSFSETWVAHAESYASQMVQRMQLNSVMRVVEVASNDGYLLRYFKSLGINVLGIEPCQNVAEAARELHGIPTISEFFGSELGRKTAIDYGYANLMIANNVLAHVPDTIDFLTGFKELLAPDGIATFEFPHLLKLIQQNQFDTIYHEHYCYLSLVAVKHALELVGLRPFDVETLATHGGSLRLFVCHAEASYSQTKNLLILEEAEVLAGLKLSETYSKFQEKVWETKRNLLKFLIDAKENGKTIVGYGAPAKGNTLLNFCGIGTDFLDFTVDISPHKQGLMLPGSRIPVYDPEVIHNLKPDYVLILPWNLSGEIMRQHSYIKDWGGRFVVPIPEVRVL